MPDTFVNPMNSKRGNYAKVIDDIAAAKICPFCPEHMNRIHPNPIQEKTFWLVTNNAYPYQSTKQHMLLVHRKHIEHVSEISVEAWQELLSIVKEETAKRGIVGGSFGMRFGDTHFTGASVAHLHAHIIQSNPDDENYEKEQGVWFRVG